jgi:uncharacterized protein
LSAKAGRKEGEYFSEPIEHTMTVKQETMQSAVALGRKMGHIFVATADSEGRPHLAAAGRLDLEKEGSVGLEAWFCPGTVMNLKDNPRISLVVWDADADFGYQLVGIVENIVDRAVMDGYAPQMESAGPSPQVERKLIIRVEKVIAFSHAPHSDLEE